jgi:hypothetical protein
LGPVPARLAGRLLTSPLAFVLGGLLDLSRFLTAVAVNRWRRRHSASTIRSNADYTEADRPETP